MDQEHHPCGYSSLGIHSRRTPIPELTVHTPVDGLCDLLMTFKNCPFGIEWLVLKLRTNILKGEMALRVNQLEWGDGLTRIGT